MANRPTKYPEWADGAAAITEPTTAKKLIGWLTGEHPASQVMNWLFNLAFGWIKYFDLNINAQMYGDGSDDNGAGQLVLDGVATFPWCSLAGSTYTMTRDANLINLVLNSGIKLVTANFRLLGQGVLTTLGGNLGINCDGAVGVAGASGGAGGTAQAAGSMLGGANGGAGGANAVGTAGTSVSPALGGTAGPGGASGSGNGGGAGGTSTAPAAGLGDFRAFANPSAGYAFGQTAGTPTLTGLKAGSGGGGGGGGAASTGGGGGAGGGSLCICFRILNLWAVGDIHCAGGTGGAGTGANGGGGGGGDGGTLYLAYQQRSFASDGLDHAFTPATNCAGGVGGVGAGAGVGGTAGSNGIVIDQSSFNR